MRRLWYSLLCFGMFLSFGQAYSQSLAPISYTVNAFQDHSCDFYAFDAQNRLVRNFQASDFAINNGSSSMQVTSVSCPPSNAPQKLSIVLCLDVSGSMSQESPSRMSTVRNAASMLVNMIDTSMAEVAITSFDHLSYINQDFTTSRSAMLQAISTLQPQGATDYNNALLAAPTGALNVATRGQYKRVVIMMTDGDGGGKVDSIVNFARMYNVSIYTISYHLQAPQTLYDIAVQTGGIEQGNLNYESLTTETALRAAFRAAYVHAQGYQPCTVHWLADRYCYVNWRYASIAVPSMGMPAVAQYYLMPYSKIPYVSLSPYSLTFGAVAPGNTSDKNVVVYAYNAAITIEAASFTNSRFQVVNWGGSPPPFVIDSGTTRTLTVRYTSIDTSYQYGALQLQSNMCYWQWVGASAGYQARTVPERTISVVNPVAPDNYNSCYYTYFRWDGVAAGDSIRVEWSYDDAKTWTMLTDNFSGNFEQWFRSPQRTGTKNRIRISHIKFQNDRLQSLKVGHASVNKQVAVNPQNVNQAVVCLAPDNNYLSTRRAYVVSLQSGDTLATLNPGSNRIVHSVMWSNDGNTIVTLSNGSPGGYVQFWNATTYQLIRTISDASNSFSCVALNAAGTRVAVGVSSLSNLVRIYDASSGSVLQTLNYHTALVTSVAFSADGSRLASGDNSGRTVVWTVSSGARVTNLDPSAAAPVTSVNFNPVATDGVLVSYTSGITRLFSTLSSSETKSFSGNIGAHYYSCFNTNGTRILSCGETAVGVPGLNRGAIIAWDPNSGNSVFSFDGSGRMNQHAWKSTWAQFTPDGSRILSANGFGGINQWTNSGTHEKQFLLRNAAKGAVVSGCFFNEDKNVATMGEDGSVCVHDVRTRDSVKTFYDLGAMASKANQVRVSANGNFMAALSADNSMALWNIQTGQLISRISNAGYGPAFSSNSQYVAVVMDSVLRVFATATGVLYKQLTIANFLAGRDLVYAYNDAKILVAGAASASNMSVVAISTSTWLEVDRFTDTYGVGGECSKISYTPGARFTTIFHAPSGRTLVLDSNLSSLGFINDNAQALTPNAGCIVGYVQSNNQVRLWRTSDFASIRTVNPHLGYQVSQVAISDNSSRALICSHDGNAWLWDCLATPIQSDTTKSSFIIGTSQLIKKDTINFGKVLNNGARDSVINQIIYNIGTSWDYIYSVTIEGYNKDEFRVVKKNTGLYLYPGQYLTYELGFIPRTKVVGIKEVRMKVVTLCDTLVFVLVGESVNPPTNNLVDQIDFGKVEVTTKKDTVVSATIKNVTNLPLNITQSRILGPDTVQFSIVSGGGSFVLQPNETRTITLRFAPTRISLTSARLAFYHAFLGSPAIILLTGEGIGIPRISAAQAELSLRSPICSALTPIDTVVRINNIGTGVMNLDSARIVGSDSVYFKVLSSFPDTIAAGSFKNIRVQYVPLFAGYRSATLRVYSNAKNTPNGSVDVLLTGKRDTVILQFPVQTLDLLNVKPFSSVDAFLTLSNRGSVSMYLPTPVQLGKFTIVSMSPNPIPSGQNARVFVNFNNGDTSMVYDTLYTVRDTCGGLSSVRLRAYTQSPRPTIYVLSNLDMENAACARYHDTTIIITNVGMKALNVSDISIVDDTLKQYTILRKPASTLAPDELDSIVIRYTPTTLTKQSAALLIQSNAQNSTNGQTRIPLSGKWNYTDFVLDTSFNEFLDVVPNTAATLQDSLRNTGTAELQWTLPISTRLFSIVSVNPNPTPIGAKAVYTLRFAGAPSGANIYDSMLVKDQCDSGRILQLHAQVQSLRPRIQLSSVKELLVPCVAIRDTFLIIRNNGLDTLRVDSLRFSQSALLSLTTPLRLPRILLPAQSDTLRIRCDATGSAASSQSINSSLTIFSNSEKDSVLSVDFVVQVQKADMRFAQSVLNFPTIRQWRKTTQQIMIYNTGRLPLRLSAPIIRNKFSLDSLSKNPLAVGDSAIAYVRFAGDSAGVYTDTLNVPDSCNNIHRLGVRIEVLLVVPAHLQSITELLANEQCYPSIDTTIEIRNTGGDNLEISKMILRGANADEFQIVNDTAFVLEPAAWHLVLLRHYSHSFTGLRKAELVMISNTDSLVDAERVVSVQVQKDSVDMIWKDAPFFFGVVDRNKSYANTVRIINDGTLTQLIPTPIKGKFYTIDSVSPNPLPRYSQGVAYIHFDAPDSVGWIKENLSYRDNCGRDNPIELSAQLRAQIEVYSLDTTVQIGQIFHYPIYIADVQGAKLAGVDKIKTTVRWNTTLMSLRSVQHASMISSIEDGPDRIVEIESQNINGRDSILAILELQAALGNDIQTPFEFRSVSSSGGVAQLNSRDAVVHISGQCVDGGTRLMDRAKATALRAIYPNPSDGNVTLDLVTPERASIRIVVLDAMGRELKLLYSGMPLAEEWLFKGSVNDLPSGVYQVVLHTATEIKTKRVEVVR